MLSCIFYVTNLQGILPTGKEIAVKRLSKNSKQGAEEFMNEVVLIANFNTEILLGSMAAAFKEKKGFWFMNICPTKA